MLLKVRITSFSLYRTLNAAFYSKQTQEKNKKNPMPYHPTTPDADPDPDPDPRAEHQGPEDTRGTPKAAASYARVPE